MYSASNFGLVTFRGDVPVWDDVLEHKQTPLTPLMLSALAEQVGSATASTGGDDATTIQSLLACNALVEQGSARASREALIMEGWSSWLTLARLFHFSTRITHTDRVMTTDQSTQLGWDRRTQSSPPSRFTGESGARVVPLPEAYEFPGSNRPFLEVVESRRTCRRFDPAPIDISDLGAVLSVSARLSRTRPHSDQDERFGNIFRNSPSGGARASTEVYVQVRNVTGVERGNYRYLPSTHALQFVSPVSPDSSMIKTMSDQSWFLDCAALFFLAGNIERYSWKYTDKRSYPSILVDAGHVSQNICLSSAALRLGAAITGVQRDEAVEDEFNIDPAHEVVVLASGIGVATHEDVVAGSFPPEYDSLAIAGPTTRHES